MSNEQSKAPKGGRKLKRIPKYRAHYSRNFDRVARNKKRRIARFEKMVADSHQRRAEWNPTEG